MKETKIILGSGSKYRAKQLRALGLTFEQIAPGIDEKKYKSEIKAPLVLASMLSDAKAEAVRKRLFNTISDSDDEKANAEYIIVGSDQLVAFEGEILGKPGTIENAVAQLLKLSGKEHSLITAITVLKLTSEAITDCLFDATGFSLDNSQVNLSLIHI